MAFTSFIPQIWNAQMLTDFREQAIAANLVNRSYEGDAKAGNTVKVNSATAITIDDYKAAGRVTSADAIASTSVDLLIDQEKSFDFYVDDIDRRQAAGSLDVYTQSAAAGLVEDADKFILSLGITGAGSTVTGLLMDTAVEAWDVIRGMRKALNKAKVPQADRVLVINAEFESILLMNDAKLANADVSGSPAGLREAALGRLLGFQIVTSENLPETTLPQALGFYKPSIAYVSQIAETEALRAEDKFADRLRGLHVYGGKVVRPTGVVKFTGTAV